MSLFHDISHLYNDSYFGSASLILDAKDRLKTRELNARAKRYLDQQIDVLEKSRDICARSRNWERRNLRGQLGQITLKTPLFDQRLLDRVRKQIDSDNIKVTYLPSALTRSSVYSSALVSPNISRTAITLPPVNSPRRRPVWNSESPGRNLTHVEIAIIKANSNSYRRRSAHVVKGLVTHYVRCEKRKQIIAEKLRSNQEIDPDTFNYRSYMAVKNLEAEKLTDDNLKIFIHAQADRQYIFE